MSADILMDLRVAQAALSRVRALAEEWEQMSDEDPFDPGNPGGYATDLRAALDGDA